MQSAQVYEPSRSLGKRIARRLVPLRNKRLVKFKLQRPIVSFTFDDCPKSALKNGISKLDVLGWKSTIYIASDLIGTTNHHGIQMSKADIIAMHNAGHEIGGHSFSHIDITEMSLDEAMQDIEKNRRAIENMGLPPCRTFAYPYGQTSAAIKKNLSEDYEGLRGITPGPMRGKVDLNQIRSTPLFTGQACDDLLGQIKTLKDSNKWLTLFTHDIEDGSTDWGCSPAEMDAVINAVKASGAEVLSVADAIAKIKESAI